MQASWYKASPTAFGLPDRPLRAPHSEDSGLATDSRPLQQARDGEISDDAVPAATVQQPGPARVSVILPTYNRTSTLRAAILSVLAQSHGNLELIVVDDASVEDVAGVIASIPDSRIRYVRRPRNGGAAAARNTGLGLARSPYIAFQDSDDVWLPDKLSRQLEIFERLPSEVGVVAGAKILFTRSSKLNKGAPRVICAPNPETRLTLQENQLEHLLSENRLSVQTALFKRECMPTAEWFDPCARANEDWEFAIRLSKSTLIFEDQDPVVDRIHIRRQHFIQLAQAIHRADTNSQEKSRNSV